ncbi:Hypothetical protein NTJ_13301 [Nesidiocoris tenuis]|uniref:Uncharacterized protein n=1 Tax=Nesidiocoris tenuis TaxID=355587 RepID=A0ABN7B7Z9_9HEMI|nr:Hypothetical protein NTJ_13301 [Nesidiocoris tenuis]
MKSYNALARVPCRELQRAEELQSSSDNSNGDNDADNGETVSSRIDNVARLQPFSLSWAFSADFIDEY